MTSEADNVAVVRAWMDAVNRNDIAAAVALCTDDFSNHGRVVGPRVLEMIQQDLQTMFPDRHVEVEDIVASGDSVIVRSIVSGTHLGVGRLPVEGGLLVGVEPTGKSYRAQHTHWWTVRDGKIAGHHANRDDVAMMVQLGLLPAPPRFPLPPTT